MLKNIISKVCNFLVLGLIVISLGSVFFGGVVVRANQVNIPIDKDNKVLSIEKNSDADRAGLKVGDTIMETNNLPLKSNPGGGTVVITTSTTLTIIRGGSRSTITINPSTEKSTTTNTTTPAATNSSPTSCSPSKSQVRWYSIATPATFIPIIPTECATNNGQIQPLSPRIIPEIIIRLFGFMISLVWLLLLPTVILAGIWYIWGGFDGTSSQAAQRLLQNALLSLLSLFFFFIIVFAFLGLFGAGNLASTDISTLFN